jgi:hypothetical protein
MVQEICQGKETAFNIVGLSLAKKMRVVKHIISDLFSQLRNKEKYLKASL